LTKKVIVPSQQVRGIKAFRSAATKIQTSSCKPHQAKEKDELQKQTKWEILTF